MATRKTGRDLRAIAEAACGRPLSEGELFSFREDRWSSGELSRMPKNLVDSAAASLVDVGGPFLVSRWWQQAFMIQEGMARQTPASAVQVVCDSCKTVYRYGTICGCAAPENAGRPR